MSQTLLYAIIALLAITNIIFILRFHTMRMTLKEIDEGLNEKLDIDTNTPISISGLDLYSKKLASDLNKQIKRLKKEQHKYETKNDDIKVAVTNIAHDIRTPLTAINGYLELFEKADLNPEEKRWLSIIQERTDSLKELTGELFSYSTAYSEVENLKPESLCPNDELTNILAGFYAAIKAQNIEPEIEITQAKIYKRLDKKAFDRIISNLLNNALKYSKGDLKITLHDDGEIVLCNKAPEMTAIDASRLFERFYTVKTANGSTGLGLSIARMLTERMGGSINAYLDKEQLIVKLIL